MEKNLHHLIRRLFQVESFTVACEHPLDAQLIQSTKKRPFGQKWVHIRPKFALGLAVTDQPLKYAEVLPEALWPILTHEPSGLPKFYLKNLR